ncbi:hypothetical protein TRIP_C21011 [Candidatus Zixiibacteriota bacterium]|nr:hypothetical protein TRIP_C21011 [candidate division Zixibacteria bacterium]
MAISSLNKDAYTSPFHISEKKYILCLGSLINLIDSCRNYLTLPI